MPVWNQSESMPTEMTEDQHGEIDVDVHRLVFGGAAEEGYEFVIPRYSRPSDIGKVIGYMCRKGFCFVVTPMRQSPLYAANFIGEPQPGTRISYLFSHDIMEVAVCQAALKVAREHPGWPNCRMRMGNQSAIEGREPAVITSSGSNGNMHWRALQGAFHTWDGRFSPVVEVVLNGQHQSESEYNISIPPGDDRGLVRITHRNGPSADLLAGNSQQYRAPNGDQYLFRVAAVTPLRSSPTPPDVRPIRLMSEEEEERLGRVSNRPHVLGSGNHWRMTDNGRGITRDDDEKMVRHPSVGEGEET